MRERFLAKNPKNPMFSRVLQALSNFVPLRQRQGGFFLKQIKRF
jgi:hypothetical protein